MLYAVFDYEIEGAAPCKGQAGLEQQIPGLVHVQFQSHSQCKRSLSGRVVVDVAAYLGEMLAVYVRLFVDLRIRKSLAVYYAEEILLEGLILLLYDILQILFRSARDPERRQYPASLPAFCGLGTRKFLFPVKRPGSARRLVVSGSSVKRDALRT